MATMYDVDNAQREFAKAKTGVIDCYDDNPNNSVYTPTLKKNLDDLVNAYKRAISELKYQRAQKEEAEARIELQERENNTKDAKTIFYALNQGLDKESAE